MEPGVISPHKKWGKIHGRSMADDEIDLKRGNPSTGSFGNKAWNEHLKSRKKNVNFRGKDVCGFTK